MEPPWCAMVTTSWASSPKETSSIARPSRIPIPKLPSLSLMSDRPVTIGLNEALAEALRAMVEGGYRHIPVVDDDGRQVGLLSSRVILRFIADQYPESVLNLPPRLHQVMSRSEGG